jgi:hypothetical protein
MEPIRAFAGKVNILGHILYLSVLALVALSVPHSALLQAQGAVFVLGAVGIWRYTWAATNFTRAIWYQRVAFPRMKRRVMALHAARKTAPHAFLRPRGQRAGRVWWPRSSRALMRV